MLTKEQTDYFDNLTPGTVVQFNKAKDPAAFLQAAKDYMDGGNYSIVISEDFTYLTKCTPLPNSVQRHSLSKNI